MVRSKTRNSVALCTEVLEDRQLPSATNLLVGATIAERPVLAVAVQVGETGPDLPEARQNVAARHGGLGTTLEVDTSIGRKTHPQAPGHGHGLIRFELATASLGNDQPGVRLRLNENPRGEAPNPTGTGHPLQVRSDVLADIGVRPESASVSAELFASVALAQNDRPDSTLPRGAVGAVAGTPIFSSAGDIADVIQNLADARIQSPILPDVLTVPIAPDIRVIETAPNQNRVNPGATPADVSPPESTAPQSTEAIIAQIEVQENRSAQSRVWAWLILGASVLAGLGELMRRRWFSHDADRKILEATIKRGHRPV